MTLPAELRSTIILVANLIICTGAVVPGRAQQKVNQSSLILADFGKRVADYVKLHNAVKAEIHGLNTTSSAESIERQQQRMAARIRNARDGVKQGNIFTPEISAEFQRLIRLAMHGQQAVRIRESLNHAEPVRLCSIRVNDSYPESTPLQSTPPSLLLNLPGLPPELEYRFSGKSIILRDIEANLIVDYLGNAIS